MSFASYTYRSATGRPLTESQSIPAKEEQTRRRAVVCVSYKVNGDETKDRRNDDGSERRATTSIPGGQMKREESVVNEGLTTGAYL
jgi:hypothetical protein